MGVIAGLRTLCRRDRICLEHAAEYGDTGTFVLHEVRLLFGGEGQDMTANTTLVGEHKVMIGHDTVCLRFRRCTNGFVLDREFVERDGTTFTQTLPFCSRDGLRAFFAADPHYETFSPFVHSWMDEFMPRSAMER